jgi:hypothetical protein
MPEPKQAATAVARMTDARFFAMFQPLLAFPCPFVMPYFDLYCNTKGPSQAKVLNWVTSGGSHPLSMCVPSSARQHFADPVWHVHLLCVSFIYFCV